MNNPNDQEIYQQIDKVIDSFKKKDPSQIEYAIFVYGHKGENGESLNSGMMGGKQGDLANAMAHMAESLTNDHPATAALLLASILSPRETTGSVVSELLKRMN